MSKPVVTYMRKKYRTSRLDHIDQPSSHSVFDAYRSKRSTVHSIAYKSIISSKKPNPPANMRDELDLQTPLPTALSESQVFRLQSSRGQPLSPNHEFSPLPLAPKNVSNLNATSSQRAYMRRNNIFLKENALNYDSVALVPGPASRSHSQAKNTTPGSSLDLKQKSRPALNDAFLTSGATDNLASPFSSRPSSPDVSPRGRSDNFVLQAAQAIVSNDQIAINTDGFACEIPTSRSQIRSTTTSPARSPRSSSVHSDSSKTLSSTRRPSAPTASRPQLDSWSRLLPVSDSIFHEASQQKSEREPATFSLHTELPPGCAEPGFRSATLRERQKWVWSDAAVDFNRPPSQLSFHSDIFDDVQGVSTPARGIRKTDSFLDDEQEMDFVGQLASRPLFLSPPHKPDASTPASPTDSWITDSLISPPSIYRQRRANIHQVNSNALSGDDNWHEQDEDIDSGEDDDVPHDNNTEVAAPPTLSRHVDINVAGISDTRAANGTEEVLHVQNSSAIDGMYVILKKERPPLSHNLIDWVLMFQSATAVVNASTHLGVDGDAIAAKTSKDVNQQSTVIRSQQAQRKRRGTIRASDQTSLSQKTTQERRSRSGTIVGPSAARRTRSGTVIGPSLNVRVTQVGSKSRTTTTVPREERDRAPVEVDTSGDTIVVDEDDPLDLFKEEWIDEDWPWAVADPPSPIASRTKIKGSRSIRSTKGQLVPKRTALKHAQFGMQEDIAEKSEGESDDELLLKS